MTRQPSAIVTPGIVLFPACAVFFLLILAFGNPPQPNGLDPAWTEVQAWGFLNRVQWGRDLINTYGPLGFLHPYSSYISGVFTPFIIGQIALPAAFALTIAAMLYRARLFEFGLFALAYMCCSYRLAGDVSWLLTLPFATTWLINCCADKRVGAGYFAIMVLAPIFAAIALTKFTAFPLWTLCVATASVVCMLERNWRCAVLIPILFALALIIAWWACGQEVRNLPLYLWSGFETAYGYGHAQGLRGPRIVEATGLAVLLAFAGACLYAAWRAWPTLAAVVSIGYIPLTAALLWLAYFTRADEFHWPGFFAAMSLLPFALLRNRHVGRSRGLATMLASVVLVSAFMGLTRVPPAEILQQAVARVGSDLHDLTHLPELRDQRESEWEATMRSASLPQIRSRVGNARIDMVTWQQGMILLNGLTYAPRPVFQSHLAATPKLARLNESYFLGSTAPEFVLFQLDYADNRFPMSEDNLALMVLLKRYRPVLFEKGYLLLQRDASTTAAETAAAVWPPVPARLGTTVPVAIPEVPSIVFIDIELNAFGKLYTLLFPEPDLEITLNTNDGDMLHYKLVRLSASTGFLLNPLVRSTHDWLKLYFSKPLALARTIRVDARLPWERALFKSDYKLAWRPTNVLHADSSSALPDLRSALFPGFNLEPAAPASLKVAEDDGEESVFLHAPASITFRPEPGRYRVSAIFGIQKAALTDADCARADPDGVGISLVLLHAGTESVLWHGEVDPFHVAQDRGPHRFRVYDVNVGFGDSVEYRVDFGHGGKNGSCDWSYVRGLEFIHSAGRRHQSIHEDGFE